MERKRATERERESGREIVGVIERAGERERVREWVRE